MLNHVIIAGVLMDIENAPVQNMDMTGVDMTALIFNSQL